MNRAERALGGFATVLLAAAVLGTVYFANGQSESFTERHVPVSVVLGQLITQCVPSMLLVGLGIVIGLVFARGLRWRSRAQDDTPLADHQQ
jgi:hypothetical protein